MRKILASFLLFSPFIPAAQEAESIAIKQVDSLIQVSRLLTGQGNFDQAIEVNTEAEKIALEKMGCMSVAYGSACSNRGRVLSIGGEYAAAKKWYEDAIAIRAEVLGKEHPDYAISVNGLGVNYLKQKDYLRAEACYLEAKQIREKVLGKEHPDYAWSLNNLAILYGETGDFDKSEQLYLETLAIREKLTGKEDVSYASSLNNLANTYRLSGNYEKAAPMCLEATTILGNLTNKESTEYASSLSNLAILCQNMGDYEKAEQHYLESTTVWEKMVGKEHPNYASSINNLATYYAAMGNNAKAESIYFEALSIREKSLGKESPEYTTSLGNLALLYQRMGEYQKAEPLHLAEKAIYEKVLGKNEPDYAMSLGNLASLYSDMGNLEKAETYYLENITIYENTLGKEHPLYASVINNLAILYFDLGRFDKAEQLSQEAKTIREKILGKGHPEYAESLANLAKIEWAKRKFDAAEAYVLESGRIERDLLMQASRHLSEREMSWYIRKFEAGQSSIFSLAQMRPGLSAACYDNLLFHKGFLLNAASKLRNLAAKDPITVNQFAQAKSINRRLADEYTKPLAERKDSPLLEEIANSLEKELVRSLAGRSNALLQVTWEEVQAKLKPGEAAIEFVNYQFMDPSATDSTMYAALVLLPGAGQPSFVPLFEEKQLDGLLQSPNQSKADFLNDLYAFGKNGNALYKLLWGPLKKALGSSVQTVYFSPSGLVHRINLGAIPMEAGSVLADRYHLVELGSTRQLVVADRQFATVGSSVNPQDALLFGGMKYDMDSTAVSAITANSLTYRSGGMDFSAANSSLCGNPAYLAGWDYLPWTEVEVTALEAILSEVGIRTTVRKGCAATEETFKSIGDKSPRILHFATHGFFFPDPKMAANGIQTEPIFKVSDHPMIRSGLLMAGGNHAWQSGKSYHPDMEDGILTAYEISQMDLSNTELVVLSACETGLGQVEGNEGVYGLQRAFKIAGAKYLVMSLWQVPDYQTQQLMSNFYSLWLNEKISIPDAFRSAQKVMREKYKNPFFWAGFVLVE